MINKIRAYIRQEISADEFREVVGDELWNGNTKFAQTIYPSDVIAAIRRFTSGEIALDVFLEWINIVFFTELFDFPDDEKQSNSIASVMTELETLDEEGVDYSNEEYDRMIAALENNIEFVR